MNTLYVGVIGDIVDSRKLGNNRSEVQVKMEDILTKINVKYSNFVVSKFLITLGDECQGLLLPSAPIYDVICDIVDQLHPVQLRFGLGFGPLNTSVKDNALGMDGPVFYSAREAIRTASNRPGHAIAFKSSVMDDFDVIKVDALFQSLSVIRKLWTDKFIKVLPLLREGLKQKEIALKIGIRQPSVSKLLNNACWGEVLELQEKTSLLLKNSFQKYVNQQGE
ncbi:MAG: SatD family protein [Clostridia bacterium]|nr:SatD family protein [Clostridia bacterium]